MKENRHPKKFRELPKTQSQLCSGRILLPNERKPRLVVSLEAGKPLAIQQVEVAPSHTMEVRIKLFLGIIICMMSLHMYFAPLNMLLDLSSPVKAAPGVWQTWVVRIQVIILEECKEGGIVFLVGQMIEKITHSPIGIQIFHVMILLPAFARMPDWEEVVNCYN
ncbi:hypothetical protein HHK36_000901 [Tetracentron sinense]|uniref:Uncharacterized protein n=1 Tax=Tetracentron sinense TaxID=13715 RepID=A0A834ZSC5_TETSI|nr:hypothetical protein HHK36_000901 [Tetracentron sinense]